MGEPDKRILQEGTAQFENGSSLFPDKLPKTTDETCTFGICIFVFHFGDENHTGKKQQIIFFTHLMDSEVLIYFSLPLTKTERSLKNTKECNGLLDHRYTRLSFRPGVHRAGVEHTPCCQSTVSEKCQHTADYKVGIWRRSDWPDR